MTDYSVYRAYGNRNALLYVGYSSQVLVRLHAHSKRSPWWTAAREITVEQFSTERAALAAEAAAITAEQPLFNVAGTGSRPAVPTIRSHARPARVRRPLPEPTISIDSVLVWTNEVPERQHSVKECDDAGVTFKCGAAAMAGEFRNLFDGAATERPVFCSDCLDAIVSASPVTA